jgi:hypothetical protein
MKILRLTTLWSAMLPLAAQGGGDEPRGPFAAITHGLVLRQGTTAPPWTADQIRHKPLGDATSPPPVFPAPVLGQPVFHAGSMFGQYAGLFELDAISTGNDIVPVDSEGTLTPALNNGWAAFTLSVTSATTGGSGTVVAARRTLNGSAGADLFGLFLPDSNIDPGSLGVPVELVNQLYLQQGAEHMGVAASAELDAHDAFMPYVGTGDGIPEDIGFIRCVAPYRFFFSITVASAAALEAARLSNQDLDQWLPSGPMHAGDVYGLVWTTNGWDGLTRVKAASEFGSNVANIDALAIDYANPEGIVYVYSTDTPGSAPLSVAIGSGSGGAAKTPSGPIDLLNGLDIDGICVYDPEAGTGFNPYIGFPRAEFGLAPKIGLSAAGDGLSFQVIVSGWENGMAKPGLMSLYAYSGGTRFTLVNNETRQATDRSMSFPFTLPEWPGPGTEIDLLAVFAPDGNGQHQPSWVVRLVWP